MSAIHGPPGGSRRAPGSVPVPSKLFLWTAERSRWAGTAAEVGSLAKRLIEEVTQQQGLGTTTIIDLSIDIPGRSWGADTPERLKEDLRVHRDVVRSIRLSVLVVAHGQVVPDITAVPTKEWMTPGGVHVETPSPPVYAAVTLSRTNGARLEVRSATSAGAVVRTSAHRQLSDAITATGNGIPIGDVDLGVTEYIDFRTKLSCAPPSIQ
jgi:hypothetical protein